ncbi:hypothetical protein Leryth_021971 [Lithospermum erythrorhizon]|nr:hypothetical protein Leryth_021971 [Lithospermum erythrorhizon]
MTSPAPSAGVILILLITSATTTIFALGGGATTLAAVYGGATTTICTLVASQPTQPIQCWTRGKGVRTPLPSATSFSAVSGGADVFCGITSGGAALLCWDADSLTPRRLYYNVLNPINSITIGDSQICVLTNLNDVVCLRGESPNKGPFKEISCGLGFCCSVVEFNDSVVCWGRNVDIAYDIEYSFSNISMMNVFVGGGHACGISVSGLVICKGNNDHGQLNVPSNSSYEFSGLALGANHSCAIRRLDNSIVCWGGNGGFSGGLVDGVSFESIVAGVDFTCGLVSSNFSVVCWGVGWPNELYPVGVSLPLAKSLPGACVWRSCECGTYPQSQELCSRNGNICRDCDVIPVSNTPPPWLSIPPPPLTVKDSSRSRGLRRGLVVFAVVGSVGTFAGILTIIYCLWTGVLFGKNKIHNSVRPSTNDVNNNNAPKSSSSPAIFSRSFTLGRQGSRLMRRQRSGTSSKHTERAEEFLFSDLVAATNNFSIENKIGAGSFGVVYRGKLPEGREVAIKREETSAKTKKLQEKENAFESELAFLSRLHHKHLVRLVGYCEEGDEKLLVYDYMKNGALYDHLHDQNNVEKSSSVLNSWRMRIKIALDAARGIEYLHNYAVPPIIHRDIKSSNILLDANWTARVSDFGLSLMGPDLDDLEFKPLKAAGTVGYIDPEYYELNVLTAKSDVYGFGVVLLELLTGKKAVFTSVKSGRSPINLVDFAVPPIQGGEVAGLLDPRIGPPDSREAEMVELLAYTAMHCVNYQGKERPTMTDIVSILERALSLCDCSHGSISSDPLSILSE